MAKIEGLEQILALIARKVRVIHGSSEIAEYGGGGDIDCVVSDLDQLWPLRLQPPARFVNRLRYDVTAASWFVASGADGVSIDTLEDPEGIGKYGFSTEGITGDGLVDPGPAATYLTIKRLRKKNFEPESWSQVGKLAMIDAAGFRSRLEASLPRVAQALGDVVLQGAVPDRTLAEKALRDLRRTRLRHPIRRARHARLQSARVVERVTHPTGLYVALVGPDGTGKSTIADALTEDHFGFRRSRRLHWRPGVLPGSRSEGSGDRDPTRPHDAQPRSRSRSIAVALYHWADFLIGSVTTILPATRRSTLIVAERPWWDLGVDPLRYRLDVSQGFVQTLGALLRKPDLVLNLSAPANTLVARKSEITEEATERQLESWRSLAPRLGRTETIDVTGSVDESIARVRAAVHSAAADRAFRHLASGWVGAPGRKDPRWWIPRGPRAVARATFDAWTPMTSSGSRGWTVAGAIARSGGLRVLPRATPPREVIERVAPHLARHENIAIHQTNHAGRFIVLFVSPDGSIGRFAKVVTVGDAAPLNREADALSDLAPHLAAPLRSPKLLDRSDSVLVLEAVTRRRGWDLTLDAEVARAMGAFAAEGRVHGDFAPWNLIPTHQGWVLVDWEEARTDGDPFEDVLHYVVQSHVLLGSPGQDDLIAGILDGRGWVGTALEAFSASSGLDLGDARSAMSLYLEKSSARLDRSTPEASDALAARDRLARAFDS
ncbi:MAG TPA: hypothetical protein VE174_07240 [Actinomycetota bacterium]|nr:hypothetical protein [Actinomycetota bacterium]